CGCDFASAGMCDSCGCSYSVFVRGASTPERGGSARTPGSRDFGDDGGLDESRGRPYRFFRFHKRRIRSTRRIAVPTLRVSTPRRAVKRSGRLFCAPWPDTPVSTTPPSPPPPPWFGGDGPGRRQRE